MRSSFSMRSVFTRIFTISEATVTTRNGISDSVKTTNSCLEAHVSISKRRLGYKFKQRSPGCVGVLPYANMWRQIYRE